MQLKASEAVMTALFLQQSMIDSQADYHRAITNPSFPRWDAVILTASNTSQAYGYKKQIAYRQSQNRLPPDTEFLVVPDIENKRVGSAGSTLSVIRLLTAKYGTLRGRRFLCIHAGGDAMRTPQYSAIGKLFSPVPTKLDGIPAALFDLLLLTMASIPGRMKEGMLLLSGDVILLFNPLMCDFHADASMITFKEPIETGTRHGVCVKNPISGNVRKFLHKQPAEKLIAAGAADDFSQVNIDTGAIALSPDVLETLYRLVETDEAYDALVNDRVRLSLYGDIAYCLAEESTLEDYLLQQPEGLFCEELLYARTVLWNALRIYRMKCLCVSPSRFLHFGSVPEILQLMDTGVAEYAALGWSKQIDSAIAIPDAAGYRAILSRNSKIGSGCYLEVSYVHENSVIGDHVIISHAEIRGAVVPSEVLLHGLQQNNGKVVCRIIGIRDNPKSDRLFGVPLKQIAASCGIRDSELWDDGDAHLLWNAKLFPECDTMDEAVSASLKLYRIIHGEMKYRDDWLASVRKSLRSGFQDADVRAIMDWNARMAELVPMYALKTDIESGKPARKIMFGADHLMPTQQEWLSTELARLNFAKPEDVSYALRLYHDLGTILHDEAYTEKCFQLLAETFFSAASAGKRSCDDCKIVKDEVLVRLPLRVNFGGGWTDTCPYCLEHGGTVLNAAIRLGGELPVEVRIVRIPERKIVFDSRDMDVHGEFLDIEPLQSCGDPCDPFALQKACLLACGILPFEGGNLQVILERLGGGFEMHSEVHHVPMGSGLGTSSILSAAAVRAVLSFMGIPEEKDALYSAVFVMEQLMSTGGGWQDQVGGIVPGIKFITSETGLQQKLKVETVKLSDAAIKELSERFAIIYTGQRRLARNLLRDVVRRYISGDPESLNAHDEIKKIAVQMRSSLERGDIDAFAHLMEEHWKQSKRIDQDSTNPLIDQIFMSIDDLIDGRMICGAGGGGFLQVILKKGVAKHALHKRLKADFSGFAVDVWDCEILYEDAEF